MSDQKMFQMMFAQATIGIIVANAEGEIVKSNPYAEELFGYKKGTLLNKKVEELLPHSFRNRHIKHRQNYHKNPIPRSMGADLELFGLHSDQSQFPVKISLSHMKIDGELFVIAFVSDDTVQQNMVKELKEANIINENISKIVEESLNEVFIFDAKDLKFTQVNKGARENIGYSFEEMQTMTPIDIKPDFDEARFRKILEPLKNRTKDKLLFETIHERKDGSTYPVEVHLQYSSIGSQSVFVAIILDMTERKKNQQKILEYSDHLEQKVEERTLELQKSEVKLKKALEKERELGELKSRFVSMASHEFRTPLSSILSSSSLIKMYNERGNLEKQIRHIDRIQSSVKNLTTILNDFLSLEKLESGKVTLTSEKINFADFINDLQEETVAVLKKGQSLEHQHEGLDSMIVDPYLVKNILLNLISNAIKYSPEETVVKINSKCSDKKLYIEIIDQGIGIPEEDKKHMFSRFFRANNVENISGTGLGLTIVKRYLNLMGGQISFTSQQGEGTKFNVEIPISSE